MFRKSSKLSNSAITSAFASFLSMAVPLCVYRATESDWGSYAGAACMLLMIVSAAVAFSAQTVSQIIRFLSKTAARNIGQESCVFKEDDPLYAKLIKKTFRVTKDKGVNLFHSFKARSFSKVIRVNAHVRTNARA